MTQKWQKIIILIATALTSTIFFAIFVPFLVSKDAYSHTISTGTTLLLPKLCMKSTEDEGNGKDEYALHFLSIVLGRDEAG